MSVCRCELRRRIGSPNAVLVPQPGKSSCAPEPELATAKDILPPTVADLCNAIRHTPAGGTVTVRVREEQSRTRLGAAARFEVEDTGHGISPEFQREIFGKFFRVPGTAHGSAGLGLSIAKEIVEAHGGEIDVESAPGRGSLFYFTLPL